MKMMKMEVNQLSCGVAESGDVKLLNFKQDFWTT